MSLEFFGYMKRLDTNQATYATAAADVDYLNNFQALNI